jgi:hypothetical protein
MTNHPMTYVLVHGAWHGSWCWQRVRKILQSAGHSVFTPTLTGLGERSHLNSSAVDLSTHIADVVIDGEILCQPLALSYAMSVYVV